MYDHIREDTLFAMLYAAVTAMALLASCYLLFRRGNAIAPDITPPARLRRWTAVYLAKTVWVLAARQLCRPGAQGGVAELRCAGHHAAGVLCLYVDQRRLGLRVFHVSGQRNDRLLSTVACGDTERLEHQDY